MNKKELIAAILEDSRIHHNISTLGMKLPYAPEGCPDELFMEVCGDMVSSFVENWQDEPRNDSGNRNLCSCKKIIFKKEDFKKDNGYMGRAYSDDMHRWYSYEEAKAAGLIDRRSFGITEDGACKEHDLWHVYQAGRMGASLYWDRYWEESNSRGLHFTIDEEELNEKAISTLKEIYTDISWFNKAVAGMMASLPEELEYRYKEWADNDKKDKREEALGYNKTLRSLLEDENPQIVRLAKGIKTELNK